MRRRLSRRALAQPSARQCFPLHVECRYAGCTTQTRRRWARCTPAQRCRKRVGFPRRRGPVVTARCCNRTSPPRPPPPSRPSQVASQQLAAQKILAVETESLETIYNTQLYGGPTLSLAAADGSSDTTSGSLFYSSTLANLVFSAKRCLATQASCLAADSVYHQVRTLHECCKLQPASLRPFDDCRDCVAQESCTTRCGSSWKCGSESVLSILAFVVCLE